MNAALPLYPAGNSMVLSDAESDPGVSIEHSAQTMSVLTDFRFHTARAHESRVDIERLGGLKFSVQHPDRVSKEVLRVKVSAIMPDRA